MAGFPSQPDAIEPEWLTARLHEAGVLAAGARVMALSWQPIGTGQVGDSARITPVYTVPGAGPATLAAKFPAADATSRATAAAFGLYAKEVRFYREIAPQLGMRVPTPLVAALAEDEVDFLLLFEDLGPARQGNQLDSCSAGDAREAIRQAAAIHAPSWNHAGLIATPWLQPNPAQVEQIAALYPNAQAIFRERYADALEPELMAVCEELNEARALWFGREPATRCIVHGDFRLDNLLFDIKGGAEPIAVLDWQTVAVGSGLTDLGYFLGTGIGDALRRAHERELLELYCAEMTRRGVPLTREAIWDEYVLGALHGVSTAVFSAAYVERTPRGDANFLSMARGGCALAREHGSLAKLKGHA